jgi:sodium transport system permease protein
MNRRSGIDWRAVAVLYARETRLALRDRTIVVNSILIPVVLYPFLLWVTFTGITFVRGQTSDLTARIAAFGLEGGLGGHAALRKELETDPHVSFVTASSPAAGALDVRRGSLDAVLEVLPSGRAEAALQVRLTWARSKERSAAARERLTTFLDRVRERALKREGASRGMDGPAWALFTLEVRNVATGREMGLFVLGLLLPLLFVVMVSVGCFYTAIDATAGERERSTWETLMTVAAPRSSIVVAKYLYVLSFGFLAGVLNLAAMALTMRSVTAPLLARFGAGLDFTLPAAGVPVLLGGALVLAAFLAAAMMLFAVFAKTFKEGQAMLTPFFMLATLPVGFLAVPGIELTTPLALVPVVNVSLVIREAITGVFRWPQIAVAAVSSALVIAATLRLVVRVLSAEEVVTGAFAGGLATFLRKLLRGRDRPVSGERTS